MVGLFQDGVCLSSIFFRPLSYRRPFCGSVCLFVCSHLTPLLPCSEASAGTLSIRTTDGKTHFMSMCTEKGKQHDVKWGNENLKFLEDSGNALNTVRNVVMFLAALGRKVENVSVSH